MTANIERKPASLRYYQEGVPTVDVTQWALEVCWLGAKRSELTFSKLRELPQVIQHRRMVCVCNWTIKRRWAGVLLRDVLAAAGIEASDCGGLYLRQESIGTQGKGKYESWVALAPALERDAIIAHTVDGEPLLPEQGYPLRFIDFGLYGYKCIKGLARLEVTREAKLGYWEELAGYPLDGTIKPKRYWVVDLLRHMFAPKAGEVTEW